MKTLHLTNAWHASSGGIGTFYRALLEAAAREGHYMRLVVPGETSRVEDLNPFCRIYTIEAPPAPLYSSYRMIFPPRYLFPHTPLQNILNEEQPDLVEISEKYTMNYLGGLLRTGRLPGVKHRPVVVGLSCERMDENMAAYFSTKPAARAFCRWYMKWIYFPMFDHHIAVSTHTAGELMAASRGHKVRRGVWVGPMGVDTVLFQPRPRSEAARQQLLQACGCDETATILFYAGRLAPEKNLGLLLDMMAGLSPRDFGLAIAGDGVQHAELQAECRRRGLCSVAFLGHVQDRQLLSEYYAAADAFVHPNPREPFGIAPLEAMSAGLALIAPNSGGITTYADNSNAWLCAPEGACFAAAAREIREAAALRRIKLTTARERALEYDWGNVTSRYLALYRELHAVTSGQQEAPALAPIGWSTPGDAMGRELYADLPGA